CLLHELFYLVWRNSTYVNKKRSLFSNMPWDFYDARREEIHFLKQALQLDECDVDSLRLFCEYFKGTVPREHLAFLYNQLHENDRKLFNQIKPFRRRVASKFLVHCDGVHWEKKRVPVQSFSQEKAKIQENTFDLRQLPRTFSEMKQEQPYFDPLLFGILETIRKSRSDVKYFEVVVHHVLVETYADRIKSNSPEGIHQDGCDYIVSALVIERENIIGAESQIFGEDQTTKLFTATLQPGMGLLQPDNHSPLWHQVTSMKVLQGEKGHRSSIGFDITLSSIDTYTNHNLA
ncbi:MAG: 2OG-Fe dioxygenase family protein, partial [Chlamydiales bacterium]|nr:2OG-Fe dioxygenase family protein [Chlamydiales bacterium]